MKNLSDDLEDVVTDMQRRIEAAASSPSGHTVPTDPPPPVEGVDLDALRKARQAAEWARVVPPVYGDPTLHKLRTGDRRHPAVDATIVDRLEAWAENPTGNLVIVGPVGTGKTFAAWATLRRVFGHDTDVYGVGAVDMFDMLRPGGDDDLSNRLRDVGVLFIDDLGAHRESEWVDERLYALINHRWEQQRPVVLTANVPDVGGLKDLIGERAYSRLTGGATVVAMYGADRRTT